MVKRRVECRGYFVEWRDSFVVKAVDANDVLRVGRPIKKRVDLSGGTAV